MQETVQSYIARGYTEIATDSGTGSRILVNTTERRVAKINQDEAYAKFAEFCIRNPQHAVPKIYSHTYPLGEFTPLSNRAYTVTEMEFLEPLTNVEQDEIILWIQSALDHLREGKSPARPLDDPFALWSTFLALLEESRRVEVGLDVIKKTNYLKRLSEEGNSILFSDPFN